jgi:hypothetical protein
MLPRTRTLVVVALALIVGMGISSVALAKQNGQHRWEHQWQKGKPFTAKGLVMGIEVPTDPSELATLTLWVEKANRILKPQVGAEVEFAVSPDVKVKAEGTDPGVFDLTLADIAVDDLVRVFGRYDAQSGLYMVTRIVLFLDD